MTRRGDRPPADPRAHRGETIVKKVIQKVRWQWWRAVRHDETLTHAQRLVAAEILDSYNENYGYSWAGSQYIADNLGLWRSTVTLAESVLEAKGYLTTKKGGGRGRSSQRTPVWSKGIDPPKSHSETVRPAGQKKDKNCPIDDVNCPTSRDKTVRPAGPDSSYRLHLQESCAEPPSRKARDRPDSEPSRENAGTGDDADARQGEAGGELRCRDGKVFSLGDTIKSPTNEERRNVAERALTDSLKNDWGVLGKIDRAQLQTAWDKAIRAELDKPGSGRAVLMRAVPGANRP